MKEHKQEDIKTNGDCCFNHIIGLPMKDGVEKPMYDYEGALHDELLFEQQDYSSHYIITAQ